MLGPTVVFQLATHKLYSENTALFHVEMCKSISMNYPLSLHFYV